MRIPQRYCFASEIQSPAKDGLYWACVLRKGHWNYPAGDDFENGFDLDESYIRE